MSRNLVTQTIKAFKGLDVWTAFTRSSPERATDLLNVIPSSSGGLEKLRVPATLSSAITGQGSGPDRFFQYQNRDGLRQVFAQFGAMLGRYAIDWTFAQIEIDSRNAEGIYDFTEANNLLFGTNGAANFKWNGSQTQIWGIAAPISAPTLGATPAGPLTFANGGRRYRISFGNSVTGHVGNASDISAATGNLAAQSQVVTGPASPDDPQADQAYLWSTKDGGANYYLNQIITITPLSAPSFTDSILDANLNTALQAPLINNVAPIGRYLRNFQGRVFIANLIDDPQAVVYSGYERILIGRPEESFPINNRFRLAIGADDIRGIGAIPAGLVIFSRSNEMFLISGILQDITVDAPIQPTAFLRQLPWSQGAFSHFSIAETPQGLVWLASDKTLQIFDGAGAPKVLSRAFNPILRRITPGTEENCRGTYFNYLEREWYALTCAIDGSSTNNLIVIVDLEPDPETNVGAFLSNLEADDIGSVEDGSGGRMLVISQLGLIKEFKALSTTVNGIADPISATSATMGAYWRSGPFGNESPNMMKMWRWIHLVRDQHDFRIAVRMIAERDDFRFPSISNFDIVPDVGRVSVNQKGHRMMVELRFPASDVSANALELTANYIPLGER